MINIETCRPLVEKWEIKIKSRYFQMDILTRSVIDYMIFTKYLTAKGYNPWKFEINKSILTCIKDKSYLSRVDDLTEGRIDRSYRKQTMIFPMDIG